MNTTPRTFHHGMCLLWIGLLVVDFGTVVSAQTTTLPEFIYYQFNEGSGTTTANLAVPGLPGTAVLGSGNWVTVTPLVGAASMQSNVIQANVVPCQTNTPINYSGSWTIEMTARRLGPIPSTMVESYLLSSTGTSVSTNSILVTPTSPDTIFFQHVTPSSTVHQLVFPNASIMFNNFHIAIVFDAVSTTLRGYLNGVLVDTESTGVPIPLISGASGFLIGGSPIFLFQRNFPGWIDEVRIWSRVRQPGELAAQGFQELSPGTVAVKRVSFATPASPMNFMPGNGTFTWTGSVASVEEVSGVITDNPASDPAIGATVVISGSYSGSDLSSFSDVLLSPVSVQIAAVPGSDEVALNTLFGSSGIFSIFRSLFDLRSNTFRVMSQTGGAATQRIGAGSILLDRIAATAGTPVPAHLHFLLRPGGPEPRELVFAASPETGAVDSRFISNGQGAVELGTINADAGGRIYNFFALNPLYALGTGPFFGMEFGPLQIDILNLPFPAPPFTPLADISGNYFFTVPQSILPPMLVVEHFSVVLTPSGNSIRLISPLVRLNL